MTTMVALLANSPMVGEILTGWEVVLMLAVVLVLFGARRLPNLARGLGEGLLRFRNEFDQIRKEFDQEAHDAGKSLGGIYGRPAAQALTPENQTAELYDPAAFQDTQGAGPVRKYLLFRAWRRLWRLIWHSVINNLKARI